MHSKILTWRAVSLPPTGPDPVRAGIGVTLVCGALSSLGVSSALASDAWSVTKLHANNPLIDSRVDAVIGDEPVLEYFARTHPDMPGAVFQTDKYGFGLPHRSPLRKQLTIEVVGALESGLVRELRTKYFGDNP